MARIISQDNGMGHISPLTAGENLGDNIWPRSFPFLVVIVYMLFFIIRPWEELMPWLEPLRVERLVAGFMILTVLCSSQTKLKTNFTNFTVLMFLGSIALASFFAIKPALAWPPFYVYITYVLFYFVLISVLRTPYQLVFFLSSYVAIMGLYLAKSQWEYFVHGAGRFDMGVHRLWGIESTYGYPNALAQSTVLTLPILYFLWQVRDDFLGNWPSIKAKWFRRGMFFYLCLAVSTIVLTNSRTSMLAVVFFLLLLSLRGSGLAKKIGCVVMACMILGVGWAFMPEQNKDRMRTLWNPDAGPETAAISAEGRISGIKAGITIFKRFPLTGVGVGNFKEYRVEKVDGVDLSPHNLFAQSIAELGILGTTAFLMMIAAILYNCRKISSMAKNHLENTSVRVLSHLAPACRDSVFLLLFIGLSGHNLLRYNWLWVGAFAVNGLCLLNNKINVKSGESDHGHG